MSKLRESGSHRFSLQIFLFIILVTIAYLQRSDVTLLLFLLLFFSLKKDSYSLLENTSTKILFLFLTIGISFVFDITNVQRGLIGISIVLILHKVSKGWKISTNAMLNMSYNLIGIEALYFLLSKFSERILQFLVFGYDNAFHLSLFRIYSISEQFPNSLNNDWPSDFALFRNYSGGYYAVSSFLSSAIVGDTDDASKLLVGYFLMVFSVFLGILLLSILLIKAISKNSNLFVPSLSVSLAFIASIGILLTNGYPPYLYALFILLLLLVRLHNCADFAIMLAWSAIAFHLTLISQPLVSWNLIPLFLLLFGFFFKKLFRRNIMRNDVKSILWAILLGLFTLFLVKDTAGSFGISQLIAAGGVQPLTLRYWLITLFVALLVLYFAFTRGKVFLCIALVSSASAPFIFLVGLTVVKTGTVGYYAIKQGYIWSYLVSLSALLFYQLEQTQRVTNFGKKKPTPSKVLIFVLLVGSLQGATTPKVFNGAFMGTLKNVVFASAGPESMWSTMGLDARQLIYAAKSGKRISNDCLLYKSNLSFSDLGSRWLNVLASKNVTEACFAVYWNSDTLNDTEISERILISGISVRVISAQDPSKT